MKKNSTCLYSIELCAGAGGQALGLEQAGFEHACLVEIDKHACQTLRHNRPKWLVLEDDLFNPKEYKPLDYQDIDLFAGGLPCPPFSVAGKQLGKDDERNLFDNALEQIAIIQPTAIMLENVRGFLDPSFAEYREFIFAQLKKMGYWADIKLFNASEFGVSQSRPRVVIVAIKKAYADNFSWPMLNIKKPPTVGELLYDLMASEGWEGALEWKAKANKIAPTIVGGSKKHGGPDLGPTRAKRYWADLGVNGNLIGNAPPQPGFIGNPTLTVQMVARIQGFPDSWHITGAKTNAYRQVGNAFPPPVAKAVSSNIKTALEQGSGKTFVEFKKAS